MRRLVLILGVLLIATGAYAQQSPLPETLGKVQFTASCSPGVQAEFNRAVALLHSFWFDASAKAFTAVAAQDQSCAMAYWGVAMTALSNPFAWPPSPKGLADGSAAVEKAKAIGAPTQRERDYIGALEAFYKDHDKVDHRTRAVAYAKAMEQLAQRYPDDREASVFSALALNATALPTDKTYAQQLKAAGILEKVFTEQPNHPGVAHYLIHSYDYPAIAGRGLPAARRYASIAPSAPHALHMPSHIFTRQGLWKESVESNSASGAAARNDFDRLHAMDYLVYAYLQTAQDRKARAVGEAVKAIGSPDVEHFVTAFAMAAAPARLALERKRWAEAAALVPEPTTFPWAKFPQSEAITHFARALGAARSGDVAGARRSIERLEALQVTLTQAKNVYWAEQVGIQQQIGAAWLAQAEGRGQEALTLMRAAAEREDATEKHPVTPGPIVPARELLGDLLLEQRQPALAVREFEASMSKEPNRLRGLYGAARAAELAGRTDTARRYYTQLLAVARDADAEIPELSEAKAFIGRK